MRFSLLLVIALLVSQTLAPLPCRSETAATSVSPPAASDLCGDFQQLITMIRDGKIAKSEARRQLALLRPRLRETAAPAGTAERDREWVFPLAGYTAAALAGGRRHGYEPRGYDFFDGNRHGGHPAIDIFIREKGRDQRDRRTGRFVDVLSVSGGIVVAAEDRWEPGSRLRGGKYLWIYDPASDSLFYYAHNRELFVRTGDTVRPGARIAAVGRTGLNAAKRRSPTHLHFSWLSLSEGGPRPENPGNRLKTAKTMASAPAGTATNRKTGSAGEGM